MVVFGGRENPPPIPPSFFSRCFGVSGGKLLLLDHPFFDEKRSSIFKIKNGHHLIIIETNGLRESRIDAKTNTGQLSGLCLNILIK